MAAIRFGVNADVDLEGDNYSSNVRKETTKEPFQLVTQSMENPIDFPPLVEAIVPGDHVAIAVSPDLPIRDDVLSAVRSAIEERQPETVKVVYRPISGQSSVADQVSRESDGLEWLAHDPTVQDEQAYLAASLEGLPIYLNRHLVDADVVIPIHVVGLRQTLGYWSGSAGVYPCFSNEETHSRLGRPSSKSNVRSERLGEVRYAESMLGICFAIRVVPGAAESIFAVVSGSLLESEISAQRAYQEVWTEPGGEADLAVATLTGMTCQSWLEAAKAIKTTSQVVNPGGHIILLTELSEAPLPSLRLLGRQDLSFDLVAREIEKQSDEHAIAAAAIAEVQASHNVSMFSSLGQSYIEDLGMGFVESLESVQRLVGRATSVRVIEDANRVVIDD